MRDELKSNVSKTAICLLVYFICFLSYFRLEIKLIEITVLRKIGCKLIKYNIIVKYILTKINHCMMIVLRIFQRKWKLLISARILCNLI